MKNFVGMTTNTFSLVSPDSCFAGLCLVLLVGLFVVLPSSGGIIVCRFPFRSSIIFHPIGGQAIWPWKMAQTGSKKKMDKKDWETGCWNLRHQAL
jgi:hypothetical protein